MSAIEHDACYVCSMNVTCLAQYIMRYSL